MPNLLLGAAQASPYHRSHAGSVYFLRGAGEPAVVDLARAGTPGALAGRIDGADPGDELGSAIASVGDLNGDGRSDIGLGAPYLNSQTGPDRIDNGGVYVLFGGRTGGVLDLARLGSRGYVAFGARDDDEAGTSVAGGVDVNGDGRSDLLIGAPYGENTLEATPQEGGAAYLVLGTGAPSLRYRSTTISGRVGVRFSTRPALGRTGPAGFTVAPALPRGLSLDPRSGAISGVPRLAQGPRLYAVAMTDLAGQSEVTLTISVAPR